MPKIKLRHCDLGCKCVCVCVQEEFIEEILIEYVNVDDEDFFAN